MTNFLKQAIFPFDVRWRTPVAGPQYAHKTKCFRSWFTSTDRWNGVIVSICSSVSTADGAHTNTHTRKSSFRVIFSSTKIDRSACVHEPHYLGIFAVVVIVVHLITLTSYGLCDCNMCDVYGFGRMLLDYVVIAHTAWMLAFWTIRVSRSLTDSVYLPGFFLPLYLLLHHHCVVFLFLHFIMDDIWAVAGVKYDFVRLQLGAWRSHCWRWCTDYGHGIHSARVLFSISFSLIYCIFFSHLDRMRSFHMQKTITYDMNILCRMTSELCGEATLLLRHSSRTRDSRHTYSWNEEIEEEKNNRLANTRNEVITAH